MERSGQSRLGVASLLISIANIIVTFIVFLVAGIWGSSAPGGVDENSVVAVILGLFLSGCIGVNMFSIGLGVAGILQAKDKDLRCDWHIACHCHVGYYCCYSRHWGA